MDSATIVEVSCAIRRRLWLVVVVVMAVLVTDLVTTSQSQRVYMARASLLIAPSSSVEPGQLVYSVDALGRSMIVGTYANMLSTDTIRREALERAGVAVDPSDPQIQIKTAALADSAIVEVTTFANDPNVAATVANAVGHVGEVRMSQLYPMYDLSVVTEAIPPKTAYRPDVGRNLALGGLLGLLLGAVSACTYDKLLRRTSKVIV